MLRTPPAIWTIPVLETERLRLRAHTLADFDTYCTLWADPEVIRYIDVAPNTREQSFGRMLRNAGHWSMLGFGSWLVEEKATSDFVGEVGLFNYRREITPSLGDLPEIGWILSPAKHGRGYATEAVQALFTWARTHFLSNQLCCLIAPENTASLRVAAKAGFLLDHTTTYRDHPVHVLKANLR